MKTGLQHREVVRGLSPLLEQELDQFMAAVQQWSAAGTYMPTLTLTGNLDAATPYTAQYLRIGNVVTVSGMVNINPTSAATATVLGLSLPLPSKLVAYEQCGGVAFAAGIAGQGAGIYADFSNARATMQWVSADTTAQNMHFVFSYQVI